MFLQSAHAVIAQTDRDSGLWYLSRLDRDVWKPLRGRDFFGLWKNTLRAVIHILWSKMGVDASLKKNTGEFCYQ